MTWRSCATLSVASMGPDYKSSYLPSKLERIFYASYWEYYRAGQIHISPTLYRLITKMIQKVAIQQVNASYHDVLPPLQSLKSRYWKHQMEEPINALAICGLAKTPYLYPSPSQRLSNFTPCSSSPNLLSKLRNATPLELFSIDSK
jgi:hypothetical protein